MNKRELVEQLGARREALALTHADIAERSGLTERSVRNALGEQANPQLSSLLALVDALGFELQLAPRGFGGVAPAPEGYRPVETRVVNAVARPLGIAGKGAAGKVTATGGTGTSSASMAFDESTPETPSGNKR